MVKLAISQSNYIPWKGYFDLIATADEFIVLDQVQFTKNDWRNRNKIITPNGPCWISIPVGKKISRRICDVELIQAWQENHWNILQNNYSNSKYFEEIMRWLKPLYFEEKYQFLSQANIKFIEAVCFYLEIDTKITNSTDYSILAEGRTERLLSLCNQAGSNHYISGPTAKDYIDEDLFSRDGIEITWMDYSNYPKYNQLCDKFDHQVSIVDLLFNCGKDAINHFKNSYEVINS